MQQLTRQNSGRLESSDRSARPQFYLRTVSVIDRRRRRRPTMHSSWDPANQHEFERREVARGGATYQMARVNGPHVELPPFGRRADDILPMAKHHLLARRVIDVVVASSALVFAAPFMAIAAVLVKTTSRGPVLFRHERVGLGGRRFEVLKFRSMKVGTQQAIWADEAERLTFAENNFKMDERDPRITRVGRLLRRSSVDELPQLINVLRGEMSIVGVRPIEPAELSRRPEIDQILYARLRPGLTGLWQTSGRSAIQHNQRIAMDRKYTAEWHPREDFRILVKTPKSLLGKESPTTARSNTGKQ